MEILTLIGSLGSGIIKNRNIQNQNAQSAIVALESNIVEAQKDLKLWRGVFVGSVVVAIVLIILLILANRK